MSASSGSLFPELERARILELWRRTRLLPIVPLILLLALGASGHLVWEHPFAYCVFMLSSAVVGLNRWRLYSYPPEIAVSADDPTAADPSKWMLRYRRAALASCINWGLIAGFVQHWYTGQFEHYVVLLISVGMTTFVASVFIAGRRLWYAFVLTILVPSLSTAILHPGSSTIFLAILASAYTAAVMFMAQDQATWFDTAALQSIRHERARSDSENEDRIKSQFLANMSHEIRTPMNGITGMTEVLLQTPLDKDQREMADTIRRSADSLLDILNDVLDFSKMQAGYLEFVAEDFHLRNVVEDVFELLAPRALEKGVDLGYVIVGRMPEWVRGDEGRLRQVLMNLVGNAIKFSHSGEWPDGGAVVVRIQLLERKPDQLRVEFSVTDHGIGMAREVQRRLFRPFMQADSSTSRRFGGTGLGLAISRQLVEAMSGSIRVESELGQGATFYFDVRLSEALGHVSREPVSGHGKRILLYEPGPASRATLAEMIHHYGAEVDAVESLARVREMLASQSYTAAILSEDPGDRTAQFIMELFANRELRLPRFYLLKHKGQLGSLSLHGKVSESILHRPVRLADVQRFLEQLGEQEVRVRPKEPEKFTGLRGHVLVAEDNLVNQRMAMRLLQALGVTADLAVDGREVLHAVERSHYDLILMDCQMPELDGYETTRILRQLPAHSHVPIIALTANAMKGDRDLCIAAGMNDYISKPIRLDRLRELLGRYLPAAAEVTAAGE